MLEVSYNYEVVNFYLFEVIEWGLKVYLRLVGVLLGL